VSQQQHADWLDVHTAMRRVVQSVPQLETEQVALADALGRTLAADIVSPIEHPPWDNSAMDGYAARADDVRHARADAPVPLRVLERVAAGQFPQHAIARGEAIRIMTGVPIPQGADSVIRIEHVREEGDLVLVLDGQDAGRNVRARGEDLHCGARVLGRGRLLRAAEIGLLATVGAARVEVARRPRVAVLSTGDELADLDAFDQVLGGRKIANSNAYALAAAIRATGATPVVLGIARDNEASLRQHLATGLAADVLVTTAGASVGDHDLVKDVLHTLGTRLEFWRVRMRPGSPVSFGLHFHDAGTAAGEAKRPVAVFGLPGNPVSALVTCELFVRPALRRMQGRDDVFPPTVRVRAVQPIRSKSGLTHFLRVRVRRGRDGELEAQLTGAQGSGLITSMAEADALLVVPEGIDEVAAGDLAWAVRLAPGDDAQHNIDF
jgi:molybdopterin molybdotransferase